MTAIGDEINSLLDEIAKDYRLNARIDGDVSVEELASATGLSTSHCSKILRDKTARGELIRVRVKSESGFPMYVYRKA